MDWNRIKANLARFDAREARGELAHFAEIAEGQLAPLFRLALAGKALAEAVRLETVTRNAFCAYRSGGPDDYPALRDAWHDARDAVPAALAAWDAIERGED